LFSNVDRNVKYILFLKLVLLFLFTSEYNNLLFQPFVNIFVENNVNPWQYYFDNNLNLDAFPYHALMLYILYPFALLSNITQLDFMFKVPLLLADLMIFYILLRLFPRKSKEIFLFYFLNPIVIYAIYIHSQLDIIPTALLLLGMYFLIQKKYIKSSFAVGFALATKFHIIIALPLIVFYLFKKENIKKALEYIVVAIGVFFILDLPFLFSNGFLNMVIQNSKQSLLFDSFYDIGGVKLLLPVVAIISVYFHFFNQNKVNDDLLFFYFGLLFTVTIFFIYPAPAWYIWMIPYIAIYFINSQNYNKVLLLHSVFSITYLIFFLFFYKSEYIDILFLGNEINLKIENERFTNISFTLLEVMLLAIMYAFYKYGIKSNSIYKKTSNLTIGIAGDSGVGKTTLLNNLQKILGSKLLQIEGDGEHKWERGDKNWDTFTHLDPKANFIHKQADAIYSLKNNETIYRSEYDHSSGKFTEPLKIKPKDFIVIAGLHPFYLPKLRKNIDLKIYIDIDEKLRRHWKIIRDTKERGYSIEKIIQQIDSRMKDANKYIYPQKDFADIVISYFPINEFILGNGEEDIKLGLKVTFDANIHIEDILNKFNFEYTWDYNQDLKTQYIELKTIPMMNFAVIAIDTITNINEIVDIEFEFTVGYDGLIQLILLKMISEKLQ
jgi:uridine kinase